MKLKFLPFCSSLDAVSDGIIFCRNPWTNSQAFWSISRPFFVVLFLLTGRFQEVEIGAILLLFRC